MNKFFAFLLLISVLIISGCSNSDELAGQTFNIAYKPVIQEDLDNPNRYSSILRLEFSDGNAVTSTGYGEGTYELNGEDLGLYFENENENLEIIFAITESDKDFSEYYAEISDFEYKITDPDKIRHLQTLAFTLNKGMPIEFIKN